MTPISIEVDSILNSRHRGHVILIDDARLFDGVNDYPPLEALISSIRNSGKHNISVVNDIVCIVQI